MIHKAVVGEDVEIIGSGRQTRDFTYVEDVCDAVLLAIEKKATGIYNVSAMQELSIVHIVALLQTLLEKFVSQEHIEKRSIDNIDRRSIDSTKIQTELGWKPKHTFEQGLQKTIDWYLTEMK
jgi:dTDP-glucose 4,6-dehydratase